MGAPAQGIAGVMGLIPSMIGSSYSIQDFSAIQQSQLAMAQNSLEQFVKKSEIETVNRKEERVTMFGSIKKYFDDHRDLLMTLAVLVIVDQFVFDGAFKEKIKSLIDRVVGHADNKIKQLEAKQ